MNSIIFKYIQLFCVVVLFNHVKCEQLLLKKPHDEYHLKGNIGCTAACMRDGPANALEVCYQQCSEKPMALLEPLIETSSDETFRLICRDAEAVDIEVQSNVTPESGELYAVRVLENDNQFASSVVYITDSAYVKVNELALNTSYNMTVSIFNAMMEYRHLPNTMPVRTLPSRKYRPQIIPGESIDVSQFTINENPKVADVYVKWAPAEDMVCHYGMILYETVESLGNKHEFQRFKIVESQQLYSFQASNLVFGSNYYVAIRGINTYNETIEGPESNITFETPTCWEMHAFNMSLCPPEPLQNLTSTHSLVAENVYNINVTWEPIPPEQQPINYTVSIFPHYSDAPMPDDAKQPYDVVSLNATGDTNYAYFHHITLSSINYFIQVRAHSKGGSTLTTASESMQDIYKIQSNQNLRFQQGVIVLKIVSPFLLVLLVVLIVRYCRMKLKRNIYDQSEEIYLRELLTVFHKDNMEVKRSQIELYETLGEGAFGIVRRGKLMPQSVDVAVKMVKGDSSSEENMRGSVKELLREIQLMKSVCQHENIVGIVGHYTTDTDFAQLMLLTEYCSEGNLLNYLRASRRQSFDKDISTHSLDKSPDNFFHFDISLAEKPELKYRNSLPLVIGQCDTRGNAHLTDNSTLHYPEKNIQNLIVNRLYNELSTENNNSKFLEMSKPFTCNNSCKCRVEIISHGCTDTEPMKRCTIKIEDCDCQPNGVAAKEPTKMLLAENRGYEVLTPGKNNAKMNGEQIEQLKNYGNEDETPATKARILKSIDLLNFAKQIASGMEFLANNKIVHRDLAARNVLVCADKTVKIADFGLSRDIYEDNIYKKSSAGRLPIKWLALESMLYQQYTSQSDVWSYGILLYEIVTLGCTPYPTVPANCLVHYLKSGNRMSRPSNCSKDFYDLMESCWRCECEDRPSFSEINGRLEYFTTNLSPNILINIDDSDNRRRMVDLGVSMEAHSDTSYLKPI